MDDPAKLANLDLVDSIVAITEQRNIETLETVLAETVFATLRPREVVMVDLHENEPSVVALFQDGEEPLPFDLKLDHCSPEAQAALAEYLAKPNAERGPEFLPEPPLLGECGIFPVLTRSRVEGVLCIRPEAFAQADWRLAAGLVNIYRNFVEVLNEKDHDRLTGLRNRTLLEDQILRRLSMARRRREKRLAEGDERRKPSPHDHNWLAILDIDHFKSINDSYGHIYGDEVLLLISAIMHKSFRRVDQLYRYGGEEFIVLLQGVDAETAQRVLERFRESVARFDFPQVGTVTVSIGYVEIKDQDQPTTVIGHADQALYYAKNNGRNQTASYEALAAAGRIAPTKIGSIELF